MDFLNDLEKQLKPGDFEEKPVSIEIFFRDWLGQPLYSEQIIALRYIFGENPEEWNQEINEALLLWGKGAGKDWLIARVLVYVGYWLMCLKDPQKYFGIGIGTPIDFANVSINSALAKDVFFKEFVNVLRRLKNPKSGKNWFAEKGMDLRDDQDVQTRKVIFSPKEKKNITAYSLDSERYTGEGKNLLVVIFDEVGAFKVNNARKLHDNLIDTQRSRFPKHHKMILMSYKYDDNDYMQIRWRETKEDKNVYRSLKRTWEVNVKRKKEDFQKKYDKDPEGAERVYECRGSSSETGYFKYKKKIRENVNQERHTPLLEQELRVTDIIGIQFKSWFKGNYIEEFDLYTENKEKEKILELLKEQHSDNEYFIHIDLAKGSEGDCAAGFAMVHPYLLNPFEEETERGIYVDLMIQIKAEDPNGEIIFGHIRNLILNKLRNELGFNIKRVTLDGYQSVDFIQIMKGHEIESKLLSVDKDTEAYDTLKGLIYKNNINYYPYNVFFRECEELKKENGKVDHPSISQKRAEEEGDEKGSKDVSDAVAGATKSALEVNEEEGQGDFVVLEGEE